MRICINLTSLCSNIFPPSIIRYRAFNSVRRSKISDYYDVLGVPSSANSDELKRAFYAMSKKYHPDLNGTNEASAQKFLEVKMAYDTLKDEEKRREYDSRMCTATQEMRPPPHFTANRPRQRHSQSNTSSPMARQMFLQRILFMHSHNPAMEEFNRERQWRRIKLFATGFLIFLASYYYFIRIVHSGK